MSSSACLWEPGRGNAINLYDAIPHNSEQETENPLVSGWLKNTNFKSALKAANPVDPEYWPTNTLWHTIRASAAKFVRGRQCKFYYFFFSLALNKTVV